MMGGVKWMGTYRRGVDALESADVYGGQLAWTGVRATMEAAIFLVVAAVLGGVESVWGVLAIPARARALAIGAPLSAWASPRTAMPRSPSSCGSSSSRCSCSRARSSR